MRHAFVVAALAVMVAPAVSHAKDCTTDPKPAIQALEDSYKQAKKDVSAENQKLYTKALNRAKMAARTKQNDVACNSVAEATALIAKK